jgi:plasmid stabilization system protein ParE
MAKVVHSAGALAALDSALKQKIAEGVDAATAAAVALHTGISHLASHPLVGRRIEGDLRELVISYGATGYIALYRFIVQRDEVRILALRHQREIGYLP